MRAIERERRASIDEVIVQAFTRHAHAAEPWAVVARDLGISRHSLYNWCRRLGIRVAYDRDAAIA